MKSKMIAVANMKGGVGKTTLVVFLAEGLAAEFAGAKVLVVDTDPQASASVSLVGDETLADLIEKGRTIEAYLNDNLTAPGDAPRDGRLGDIIKRNVSSTTHNNVPLDVSLLSCGPYLRYVEKEIVREFAKRRLGEDAYEMRLWTMVQRQFEQIRREFDYIVCDCAPGISVLNEVMIRSADLVLIPTIPDFISIYGLSAFMHTVWNYPIARLPKPTKQPYVVVTKYQSNGQHEKNVRKLRASADGGDAGYGMLKTFVPQAVQFASALAKASDGETPTFTNKYSSRHINEVISPLTAEIKGVLDGNAA